ASRSPFEFILLKTGWKLCCLGDFETVAREKKKGASESIGNASLVGTEKSGTWLSPNLFIETLPPNGRLLGDVPLFEVQTDSSTSLWACHGLSETIFLTSPQCLHTCGPELCSTQG